MAWKSAERQRDSLHLYVCHAFALKCVFDCGARTSVTGGFLQISYTSSTGDAESVQACQSLRLREGLGFSSWFVCIYVGQNMALTANL